MEHEPIFTPFGAYGHHKGPVSPNGPFKENTSLVNINNILSGHFQRSIFAGSTGMSWFSRLTGIKRETPRSVRKHLTIEGSVLTSSANSRRFEIGTLTTPSLYELRKSELPADGQTTIRETVADVQSLHMLPENAGAAFQVASQFNLLEMTGPHRTPEDGVSGYEHDLTQGPACAIACGAGTIYRNYFHPVRVGFGQTEKRQIDCLEDLGEAIGNDNLDFWRMKNGYALPTSGGLARLNEVLSAKSIIQINDLRDHLRIGIQSDTEVTLQNTGHLVTQVYCSAMPVAYSRQDPASWRPLATLVLEAAYEATLLAAVENAKRTGNNRAFLTLLGGGAFGNSSEWIVSAIVRALQLVSTANLEIHLVSYGTPSNTAHEVIRRFRELSNL